MKTWWARRSGWALALLPLAWLYAGLSRLHRGLYRAKLLRPARLPVPVLVVGNLVAGGGGKTPLVLAIAQRLRARGLALGIVSRGYGRSGEQCLAVTPHSLSSQVGDEPLMLAQQLQVPVYVAAQRAQAAQALLAAHPNTALLISDDGLQHYALASDWQICVWDARGQANGWLLPAGPLRAAHTSATWVLYDQSLSGPGLQPALARVRGAEATYAISRALGSVMRRADGKTLDLAALRGQPVCALAGIANPEAFFALLREQGLSLETCLALPDHYAFTQAPTLASAAPLLCTEKDAVKLWRWRPDAWAVALELSLPQAFWQALDARLARLGLGSASEASVRKP